MGYTHYWTPKKVDQKTWDQFVDVAKAMWKDCPSEIAGGDGEGFPEFSAESVWFNGVGGDAHETFALGRGCTGWDFCKTNRKPYDVLVTACLLAAKDILGYEISSDGGVEDWEPGRELYAKHALPDEKTGEAEKIFEWLGAMAAESGYNAFLKEYFINYYKQLK